MRSSVFAFALLLQIACAGCYQPLYRECFPCTETDDCPGAMTCVAGYCTASKACSVEQSDAQQSDALQSDALLSETSDAFSDLVTDAGTSVLPSDGLVLWLDPADGVTTTAGFAWQDRSNQHNDARAPFGAEPMLEQPWTGLPPAVWFSGDGQYLKLPTGMSDFTGGLSLFVVAEPWARLDVAETDAARFIDFATAATSEKDSVLFCRYHAEGSGLLYQVYVGDTAKAPTFAKDAVGNYSRQLLEVVAGGGKPGDEITTRYFKNGGALLTGSALPTGSAQVPYVLNRTSNLIGRSNFKMPPPDSGIHPDPHYRGFIAEMILYNRTLSDDERRAVETYLLTRWHLP